MNQENVNKLVDWIKTNRNYSAEQLKQNLLYKADQVKKILMPLFCTSLSLSEKI